MSAADGIIGLYRRHAQAFDSLRDRSLFEAPWLDPFVELVPSGGSIVDIGCGAGEPIARHLMDRGFRVTGVDTSETLLNLCRQRLPRGDFHLGDMRHLALGRRFDALIAWNSFFHLDFDSQRAMFPVFAAHARDGAPLMFTSGPAHGEAIGNFQGEPLFHASLAPQEYESLLAANHFEVLAHKAEDPACRGHTVWLARRKPAGAAITAG